jgi:peptidoglycan/xylan/chitin deacetylase (PgdA/CDA1 family)
VRRWIENEQVRSPLTHWDVFGGQISVRRSVFETIGGFDEDYTRGDAFSNEDADLGVRLLSSFEVRHNSAAVTRQKYFVTPRQSMARASKAVEGDLHFLSKHPEFSREMYQARGMERPLTRLAYRPLSRIPLVAKLLSAAAVATAEVVLKTPFRSNWFIGRLFSGCRMVAYWARLRSRCEIPGNERLLTLCYHAISDQSADPVLAPYGIPRELFVQQLDDLVSAGFSFVTPDALANFLRFGAPLPRRPVLLTFDDCYEDLLEIARNILKARGIQAIAFAVTGMKSGTNEWDQAHGAGRFRLLTGEELRELASLGVEIGSHSRTHREMPLLGETEQEEEASRSADDLAALGLPRPRFFAYPFGSADEQTRSASRKAGYLACFGSRVGHVRSDCNRYDLPRVGVYACDRGLHFRAKVSAPRLWAELGLMQQRLKSRIRKIRDIASGAE